MNPALFEQPLQFSMRFGLFPFLSPLGARDGLKRLDGVAFVSRLAGNAVTAAIMGSGSGCWAVLIVLLYSVVKDVMLDEERSPSRGNGTRAARAGRYGQSRFTFNDLSRKLRMKPKLHVGDFLRISGGTKDFAFVFFKRFDPICDIAGVLRNVGRNPNFRSNKGGRQLGA